MAFKFMLEELLRCPTKESQKRKSDNGEVKIEKKSTTMGEEAPTSLRGIAKVVPEVPTTDPEVGVPTERIYRRGFIHLDGHRGGGGDFDGCPTHTNHYHGR